MIFLSHPHRRRSMRLTKACLRINPTKCTFGVSELTFLGHLISGEGCRPIPEKVKANVNFPKPKTVVDLRRFLGMINFYRRSLPHFVQTKAPLHVYLHDSKKNDKRKNLLTIEADQAFEKIKTDLSNAVLLAYPSSDDKIRVVTDASDFAMGAFLEQFTKGSWLTLAFFSQKFTPAQKQYSAYDRKLTAAFEATMYFRYFLEGREFKLLTEHKPLIYAFMQKSDEVSPRQQETDEDLEEFLDTPELNSRLKRFVFRLDKASLYCESSSNDLRPFIPSSLRQRVFELLPNPAQPNAKVTDRIIQLLGCKRIRSIAYHPAANGLIERWHRSLKSAIMCHSGKDWPRLLSTVLLGLRTHVRLDTGASPAEFLYGTTLRVPQGSFSSHGRSSQQPLYRFDPDENTIILKSRVGDIEVVRSTFGGTNPISVPKTCTFLGHPTPRGIPTLATKGNENFQTVPLINTIDHVKYCVAYLTENEEVLGVKAPPTDQEAARDQYNGDPSLLNPNATKSYITYMGFDFEVTHFPLNPLLPSDIKHYPYNKNNEEYTLGYITTFAVKPIMMRFGVIRFFGICRTRNPHYPGEHIVCESAHLHVRDVPTLIKDHLPKHMVAELRAFKPN
ncbi:uncharacterized protein LOC117181181 [Belonocnema kinseyi]|uniref:uncharacterized protein LOC117181181 n=1 Tax=Belonocnema kinseyi TaxID=2817044 RepID=UPI00143DEE7B|nr:uncharacterized protein LOC117181181 [Belonocnema kinseyi]